MSDESVFSTAEWGIEIAKTAAPTVPADARKTLDQMVANAAQKENVILNTAAASYEGAKATRQFVGAHPWVSIGTGAAVGFLTGILIRRR